MEQGRLVIHRRPDTVIALTPTYKDAFRSSLGAIRFLRDARAVSLNSASANRASGISASASRWRGGIAPQFGDREMKCE